MKKGRCLVRLMRWLGLHGVQAASDAVRPQIRSFVHEHRNIATNAVAVSRRNTQASRNNLRVAEEAIRLLEEARHDDHAGRENGAAEPN